MIERIENRLKELLKPFEPKILYDAMSYYVFSEGKRIRPTLSLLTAKALNKNEEDAITFGCAIELIHNYSLIHDDLPALDNDEFRRGKKTCHKVFGEDIAILAGDGLLSLSFDILTNLGLYKEIKPKNLLKAANYVAKKAGIEGMVSGQVLDITKHKDLIEISSKKTAALIESSIVGIGILFEEETDLLEEFGHAIGMIFQITDDLIDKDGFYTLGEEKAKSLLENYKIKLFKALEKIPNSEELKDFALMILNRKK